MFSSEVNHLKKSRLLEVCCFPQWLIFSAWKIHVLFIEKVVKYLFNFFFILKIEKWNFKLYFFPFFLIEKWIKKKLFFNFLKFKKWIQKNSLFLVLNVKWILKTSFFNFFGKLKNEALKILCSLFWKIKKKKDPEKQVLKNKICMQAKPK